MAELADALDLGSSVERRRGSSPLSRTKFWVSTQDEVQVSRTRRFSPGRSAGNPHVVPSDDVPPISAASQTRVVTSAVVPASLDGSRAHIGALGAIGFGWYLTRWGPGWVDLDRNGSDGAAERRVDGRGRLCLGRLEVQLLEPGPILAFFGGETLHLVRSSELAALWLGQRGAQS